MQLKMLLVTMVVQSLLITDLEYSARHSTKDECNIFLYYQIKFSYNNNNSQHMNYTYVDRRRILNEFSAYVGAYLQQNHMHGSPETLSGLADHRGLGAE